MRLPDLTPAILTQDKGRMQTLPEFMYAQALKILLATNARNEKPLITIKSSGV